MNWTELKHLANEGVALAPHTRNHPLLTRVPLEQVAVEIRDSICDLKINTGQKVPVFSYPVGDHDESLEPELEAQGIEVAVTTQRGITNLNQANPLKLRRINVGRFTPTSILHAQMLTLRR